MKFPVIKSRGILIDVLIACLFFITASFIIGNADNRIQGDGTGYYDYLPSIFIHHDLHRNNSPLVEDSTAYERIFNSNLFFYVDFQGYKVNKYPCGTALFQCPFFLGTLSIKSIKNEEINEYDESFDQMIFYAAFFYLFLGIVFLRLLLQLYDFKFILIAFIQILVVFSTGLINASNNDASGSHVYSFFAITAFMYFITKYFKQNSIRSFYWACLLIGLILLLRQINILVFLLIPFLARNQKDLLKGVRFFLKRPLHLLIGFGITVAVFSIQIILWYLQTGHLFIDSYQGEYFDFLRPQMFNVLFSYKTGLFVYSPVLLIAAVGLIHFAISKDYYRIFTWLGFFFIFSYIISSWWVWDYGCSYGMRVYIEYCTIFFIPFGMLLKNSGKVLKFALIIPALATIPINLIQTYQYDAYILDWCAMNKAKYWKIFLKTHEKYRSWIWKHNTSTEGYEQFYDRKIGNFKLTSGKPEYKFTLDASTIPGIDRARLLRLEFDNYFAQENEVKVFLLIRDTITNEYHYWLQVYMIQFQYLENGVWQKGHYNFKFNEMKDYENKVIEIIFQRGFENLKIENAAMKLMEKSDE